MRRSFKSGLETIIAASIAAALPSCGDDFSSCEETRTCEASEAEAGADRDSGSPDADAAPNLPNQDSSADVAATDPPETGPDAGPSPCEMENGGCDVLTQCDVTEGEAQCSSCPAGYTGDGTEGCVPLLSALTPSLPVEAYSFDPEQTEYTVRFGLEAASVHFTLEAPEGTITYANDEEVADTTGELALALGDNPLTIRVERSDVPSLSTTYRLVLQRAPELFTPTYIKDSEIRQLGYRVALSGDTLAVGSTYPVRGLEQDNNESRPIVVFRRASGRWMEEARFDQGVSFGSDLALDGDTLVANLPLRIYRRSGTAWSLEASIETPPDFVGLDTGLGWSVSISGDVLALGAPGHPSSAAGVFPSGTGAAERTNEDLFGAGAAMIYERTNGTWREAAFIKPHNPGNQDAFGERVQLDGDTLAVAAPEESGSGKGPYGPTGWAVVDNDQFRNAGAVYIFRKSSGTWRQEAYIKAAHPVASTFFGSNLALKDSRLVVGVGTEPSDALGIFKPGVIDSVLNRRRPSGAVFVYSRVGPTWATEAFIKPCAATTTSFGDAVAFDGKVLAVAASGIVEASRTVRSAAEACAPTTSGDTPGRFVTLLTQHDGEWTRQALISAPNPAQSEFFARGVAVDQGTLIVSTPEEASDVTGIFPPGPTQFSGDNLLTPNAGAIYAFP